MNQRNVQRMRDRDMDKSETPDVDEEGHPLTIGAA